MNERGFFMPIGICFLIVAMFLVRGLQESAGNYFDITSDFQTEIELQNIADSALMEAVQNIKSPGFDLKNHPEIEINGDYDAEIQILYKYAIYNDNGTIYFANHDYIMDRNYTVRKNKEGTSEKIEVHKKGVILISVASREGKFGKVYRRSLAYVLEDNDGKLNDKKIYFMNDL